MKCVNHIGMYGPKAAEGLSAINVGLVIFALVENIFYIFIHALLLIHNIKYVLGMLVGCMISCNKCMIGAIWNQ